MELSKRGAAFIRAHEGFVPHIYVDAAGVNTIGIGFTWRSSAFRKWWAQNKPGVEFTKGATMTRAEAEDALIALCREEYGRAVNTFYGKPVPQHVFDAMVSAVFNLGPGALKWKWAAAARRGDYAEAATLLRKTGTTAKGKKLPGLVRRRDEEATLLEHGIYTGIPPVAPAKPAKPPQKPADAQEQPAPSEPTKDTVAHVQARLRELGYSEVGPADGKIGKLTRTAILAFRQENDLPLSVEIDDEFLTALAKAKPRELPRNETASAEVIEKVPEVAANWRTEIASRFGIGGAGLVFLLDFFAKQFQAGADTVQPYFDMAARVPVYVWALALLIVLGALYANARWGKRAGIEAFREGARR